MPCSWRQRPEQASGSSWLPGARIPGQRLSPVCGLLARVEGESQGPQSRVLQGPEASEKGLGGHQKQDRVTDDSRSHLTVRDQATRKSPGVQCSQDSRGGRRDGVGP